MREQHAGIFGREHAVHENAAGPAGRRIRLYACRFERCLHLADRRLQPVAINVEDGFEYARKTVIGAVLPAC